MKKKRIGICLAVLILLIGAAFLIRMGIIRQNMLPYAVSVASVREGSAPNQMAYGFWAIGDAITVRAFVYDMEQGTHCDGFELPVQQMDKAARKQRARSKPNVWSDVGWTAESGGEVDLNGLPDGSYGVAVEVYRDGECVETAISAHAYRYQANQPEAAESDDDVQINENGLYAAHLDDWSGMVFGSREDCIVPVTGYLFSDESYELQVVSCRVDGALQEGTIDPESLFWQKSRASAQAVRSELEEDYGTTLGKQYQGGFAYAIPTKTVQQLADGRHQVNLTLTLKDQDGELLTISLDTVFAVSVDGAEVKQIQQFVLEHCN